MPKKIRLLLILQVLSFSIMISSVLIVPLRNYFRVRGIFLLPMVIYSVLGMILFVSIMNDKTKNKNRKWMMISALSSSMFFVLVIMHNAFYALSVMSFKMVFINIAAGWIHAILFIMAVILCPLIYALGIAGIILTSRKRLGSL